MILSEDIMANQSNNSSVRKVFSTRLEKLQAFIYFGENQKISGSEVDQK